MKKFIESLGLMKKLGSKTCIDMKTDLRKKATNDFEKGFFKLMNTSLFGKTMENLRKQGVTKIMMNKSFYLGLSKLDLSKTVMFKFWYDYIKVKNGRCPSKSRWYL